jgi:hypothetical protein
MMRRLLLALILITLPALQTKVPKGHASMLCVGAVEALMAAQEKSTPPGEWCQRPVAQMSKKAHPCECHKHDCLDNDPSHVSAHVDSACLNYCNVSACLCGHMDCP